MMHEGDFDLSLFGGQGSATIGPPIFMHRASNPGPTVPRKQVVGASLRLHWTWLEASAFSALELTPHCNRATAEAALGEFAARTPAREATVWTRSELNQREESPAFGRIVSSPWFFQTFGLERVIAQSAASGLSFGLFGETTFVYLPPCCNRSTEPTSRSP